jgi:hypothetical protein
LKKIGRGGGAEDDRKSKNLKKIKIGSMLSRSNRNKVAKKVMMLTQTTSATNIKVVRMISGSLIVLFIIFLIIRPR